MNILPKKYGFCYLAPEMSLPYAKNAFVFNGTGSPLKIFLTGRLRGEQGDYTHEISKNIMFISISTYIISMKSSRNKEAIIHGLKSRIALLEFKKRSFIEHAEKIFGKYQRKEISYYEYKNLIDRKIDGKNLHEWVEFIGHHIEKYKEILARKKEEQMIKSALAVFSFVFLGIILAIVFCSIFNEKSSMHGNIVQDIADANIETTKNGEIPEKASDNNENNETSQEIACFNEAPDTNLKNPGNLSIDTDRNVQFKCSASDYNGLKNISLYWNYPSGWHLEETLQINEDYSKTAVFNKTNLSESDILWNCRACDRYGKCSYADSNWSLNVSSEWKTPESISGFCGEDYPNLAGNTIDQDTGTYWKDDSYHRHYIIYNLGRNYSISSIMLFDSSKYKSLCSITVWISEDFNFTQTEIAANNISFDPESIGWQTLSFSQASGKYIKIEFDINKKQHCHHYYWGWGDCQDDDDDDSCSGCGEYHDYSDYDGSCRDCHDCGDKCNHDILGSGVFSEFVFNISKINNGPVITYVSPIENQNPSEASFKTVEFYTTVYDADGVGDIDDSSIEAEFTKANISREDNSCSFIADIDGYSANYSCSIKMWYFDSPGYWNINVTAADLSEASAENSSEYFQYNQLQAITISPNLIDFGSVLINSTNKTAVNDPTIISNTGNANLTGKIALNALDLHGTSDSTRFISASVVSTNVNFSGTVEECAGTLLANATDIMINKLRLEPGNLSAGKAQEKVYYCLTKVQNLTAQRYTTEYLGSWTIKVLSVLITASLAKKRRKQNPKLVSREKILEEAFKIISKELEEKFNLPQAELYSRAFKKNIPVSVFSYKLGALEALVKYLKENLCMSYHQIAELIHRDDRTIWASYRAAGRKMKEKMDIKGEPKMFLPISIFKNRKLTVLGAAVVYLKDKGVKYSEISGLTGRNQKNIWTIYSRAAKKQHGQKHRNI